jgi:hypothetical protein
MLRAFFDDSVPGRRRLLHVFWIDGVLVSHVLFLALLAIYETQSVPAFVVGALAFLVYTAWIMRSIWLNAGNVGRSDWGVMARVLTFGWTINSVTVCTFLVLARLEGQPLQFLG